MLANITAFGVLTRLRLDESADARREGEKEKETVPVRKVERPRQNRRSGVPGYEHERT